MMFGLQESKVRAAKDHGKRFRTKLAASFIGMAHSDNCFCSKPKCSFHTVMLERLCLPDLSLRVSL